MSSVKKYLKDKDKRIADLTAKLDAVRGEVYLKLSACDPLTVKGAAVLDFCNTLLLALNGEDDD